MTRKEAPRLAMTLLTLTSFAILPQPLWADGTSSFEKVIPFATATGRLGFFDQSNGKIFVYDENWKNCVFKGQVKSLGEPLATFTESSSLSSPEEELMPGKNISIDEKGSKTITLSGDGN